MYVHCPVRKLWIFKYTTKYSNMLNRRLLNQKDFKILKIGTKETLWKQPSFIWIVSFSISVRSTNKC